MLKTFTKETNYFDKTSLLERIAQKTGRKKRVWL